MAASASACAVDLSACFDTNNRIHDCPGSIYSIRDTPDMSDLIGLQWPLEIWNPFQYLIRFLSSNFLKSRSHEIDRLNHCVTLKFDRRLGRSAAKTYVKCHSVMMLCKTKLRLNKCMSAK